MLAPVCRTQRVRAPPWPHQQGGADHSHLDKFVVFRLQDMDSVAIADVQSLGACVWVTSVARLWSRSPRRLIPRLKGARRKCRACSMRTAISRLRCPASGHLQAYHLQGACARCVRTQLQERSPTDHHHKRAQASVFRLLCQALYLMQEDSSRDRQSDVLANFLQRPAKMLCH